MALLATGLPRFVVRAPRVRSVSCQLWRAMPNRLVGNRFASHAATPDSSPAEGAAEPSSPAPQSSSDDAKEIDEKERQRRARISAANTGRVPWNAGRKHSPETIAKIRERTKLAMQRKEVAEKVQEGRDKAANASARPDVRERISQTLRKHHAAKRQEKEAALAAANPEGAPAPAPAKRRRSPRAAHKPQDAAATTGSTGSTAPAADPDTGSAAPDALPDILPRPRRRAAASSTTSSSSPDAAAPAGPKPPPRRPAYRSPEHRAAISEAIRRKWQDPEYR
ncbi:hypothetical protein Agub_g4778, partial [Astrephomene gubernaculifera]